MATKRQVLFVQGGGEGTHDEWDNKLVDSLGAKLGQDYDIHYPRMPNEGDPSYGPWKKALERSLETLPEDGIAVGHSIGGTILLRVLAEAPVGRKLAAVILVAAPFVGDGGWPSDDDQLPSDLGGRLPQGVPVHFFHGRADSEAPPAHVDLYARAVPQARVHHLPGRDHQLNNDLSEVAATILSLDRA